jgi:hypothetical protein
MEQQTSAERRRRAMILEAQGERRSAVETAQGDKGSNIIRAQGEKQAQILEAQGDAVSTVLRARSADAMGERAIIDKGLETLGAIGADESTTYVLPQELTSTVGRYGKHLTGSDAASGGGLDGLEFDAGDREMLGLDDIEGILDGVGAVDLDGEGDGGGGRDPTEGGAGEDDDPLPDADEVAGTVETAAAEVTDAVEDVTEEAEAAAESDAVEDVEPEAVGDGEVPPPDEVEEAEPMRDADEVLGEDPDETVEWEEPDGDPEADPDGDGTGPDGDPEADPDTETDRSG